MHYSNDNKEPHFGTFQVPSHQIFDYKLCSYNNRHNYIKKVVISCLQFHASGYIALTKTFLKRNVFMKLHIRVNVKNMNYLL
jgi:hypothetical protein